MLMATKRDIERKALEVKVNEVQIDNNIYKKSETLVICGH
jgi:hypothetical protein